MKKFTRILNICLIVLFTSILLYRYLFPRTHERNALQESENGIYIGSPDPDSAFLSTLSTNLPYHTYKRLMDSVHRVALENKWAFRMGESMTMGNVTVATSGSVKFPHNPKEDITVQSVSPHYYLGLTGYVLNNNISVFHPPVHFHKNGKDSIKYWTIIPSKIKEQKEVNDSLVLRKAAVPFYYEDDSKTILFPASKASYTLFKIIFYVTLFVYGIAIMCVLACIVNLMLAIANGDFFTVKNKQRLYIIATAVFTATFLPLAISCIMKWVYLPKAGNYVFPDTTGEPDILWLAPGFLLFLFAQAFKRGLELQEEHDLTV